MKPDAAVTRTLIEGARNFRDIGGRRTTLDLSVKNGRVFRSAHLANLTDQGLRAFTELGIRTVIDFRPGTEQELTGYDRLPQGVRYVNLPIGDPTMAPEVHTAMQEGDFTALHDLEAGNRSLIRDYGSEFGQALRMISDSKNLPLVFHCIGGKDRTGMASLLLLALLGVPRDALKEDYLSSNDAVAPTPEAQEAFFNTLVRRSNRSGDLSPGQRHALRRFFILEESYFDAAWDEIHQVAGTLDSYARRHLGLGDDHIASLRSLLLDPT